MIMRDRVSGTGFFNGPPFNVPKCLGVETHMVYILDSANTPMPPVAQVMESFSSSTHHYVRNSS